jgi:hypothetical protein
LNISQELPALTAQSLDILATKVKILVKMVLHSAASSRNQKR